MVQDSAGGPFFVCDNITLTSSIKGYITVHQCYSLLCLGIYIHIQSFVQSFLFLYFLKSEFSHLDMQSITGFFVAFEN